ncbi:DDB1- and CUL4-associated factor 11 [Contarinia nasturtii]|uniref:DDB1- and CUL4-associated factor 11 n=1 Tax=Contarinia nasturtii TaxID=265458 RepID=UPI0012D429A6|nr:DDB1- and CUL4-associated factor 11 [Contarinia nasturtii]
MGNIMDNDHESDSSSEDIEIGYDIFNLYLDVNEPEPNSNPNDSNEDLLNLLLQRFINTNRFNFDNSAFNSRRFCMPQIKAKTNLEALKKNYIYQSIKYGSGYGTDNTSPVAKWSIVKMLQNRQNGIGSKQGQFLQPERCKVSNNYLPNSKEAVHSYEAKVFCGIFSRNGKHFVTASQDNMIRIHDSTTMRYKCQNEIMAKDVNWCILDIAFSPDSEHFVYSTWSNCLHLSRIDGTSHQLKPLYLQPSKSSFCIFSLAFSNCGDQIIGGGSDGCLYIYDLVMAKRTFRCPFEQDAVDVNAVGFIDETSNIIFSGSDNGIIKIWDRRCLNETNPKEVGIFSGHLDGITYIDSKNDARYLISNSKDQTIKLWDMRVFSPSGDANQSSSRRRTRYYNRWDYRWDTVPKEFYTDTVTLSDDASIMTYRGHRVKKTLIRAKFSPQETTGQRYIYTGCGTGRLIIYDVLTGKIMYSVRGHKDIVRDVAWHPSRSEILTSSWDFNVNLNWRGHKKKVQLKRSLKDVNQDDPSANDDDNTDSAPPPRRSRRLALRRQAQQAN